MPYAYDGICYGTDGDVLQAFAKHFPRLDGSAFVSLQGMPTISPSGQVAFSVSKLALDTATTTTTAATVQLTACEQSYLDQIPVQSLLFTAALCFAAFNGFKTGYRP